MKKIISILIAVLMSAASSAQVKVSHASVNPEMSKLFEELTQLGRAPMVQKTGGMGQWGNPPRLNYSVRLWFRPDLWYSRQRKEEPSAEKTSFEKQVKAIRRTLDKLAKEAQDKYLYDNHKSGKDTIYYAMNLSHDTTRVYKLQEATLTTIPTSSSTSSSNQPSRKGPSRDVSTIPSLCLASTLEPHPTCIPGIA